MATLGDDFDGGFGAAPAAGDGFDAGFQAPAADMMGGGYVAAQDNGFAAPQEAADADFFSSAAPGGEAADAGNGEAAMVFAEPTTEDPRIAWAKKNADLLATKDREEAAAKVEQLKKAQNFLKQQAETRTALLAKRKAANREAERVSNVALDSVPKGNTPWERVVSVINFNADGIAKDPHKEMSRFKNVLLTAKKVNVPLAA